MKKVIILNLLFQLVVILSYSQDYIHERKIDTVFYINKDEDFLVKYTTTIRNSKELKFQVFFVKIFNKAGILKEQFSLDVNNTKNGIFFSYHNNGKIKEEALYIKGRMAGLYIKYYSTEVIEQIGFYKTEYCNNNEYAYDTIHFEGYDESVGGIVSMIKSIPKSIKQGKWFYYDLNGKLEREEEYNELGAIIKE